MMQSLVMDLLPLFGIGEYLFCFLVSLNRGECTDSCKLRRSQIESELKQTRRELKLREDQIRQLERERQVWYFQLIGFYLMIDTEKHLQIIIDDE